MYHCVSLVYVASTLNSEDQEGEDGSRQRSHPTSGVQQNGGAAESGQLAKRSAKIGGVRNFNKEIIIESDYNLKKVQTL